MDPENTGTLQFAKLKEVMEDKLKDKDTPADMIEELKHMENLDKDHAENSSSPHLFD